jgi:hypothetical protein
MSRSSRLRSRSRRWGSAGSQRDRQREQRHDRESACTSPDALPRSNVDEGHRSHYRGPPFAHLASAGAPRPQTVVFGNEVTRSPGSSISDAWPPSTIGPAKRRNRSSRSRAGRRCAGDRPPAHPAIARRHQLADVIALGLFLQTLSRGDEVPRVKRIAPLALGSPLR